MLKKFAYLWCSRSLLPLALFLLTSLACVPQWGRASQPDPYALVWEAWATIEQSYPNSSALDMPAVTGSAIAALPGMAETSPYPFLTEVGRLRGQPPVGVPPELADLWRALTLHQKTWPAYTPVELSQAAIAGMALALPDARTAYFSAADYPQAQRSIPSSFPGAYQGIGASVDMAEGVVRLVPQEGGPADQAGLQPGDALVAVNGKPVAGLSLDEVTSLVRGASGTGVRLRVQRAGQPGALDYQVVRRDIEVTTATYQEVPGNIGYLAIHQLRDNTGQQTARIMESLRHDPPVGLILDLRAVPEGSSTAALEVAGQFLPAGTVLVFEKERAGQRKEWIVPNGQAGVGSDVLPLAVLVDEGTLGPAEALAAGLQAAHRAMLVGVATPGDAATYGFALLSDGSALYLPTALWHTSNGELLSGVGLRPDIEMALQQEQRGFGDSQLNRAYEYLDRMRPVAR
ncbi:MAG: PDZ domain-containing protein [SAR202 cluster bacterium]|nr:PDZ domain-containing protein [SAR202 cluster bacterium]